MLSSALFLLHRTRLAKEGVCASIGHFYLKKIFQYTTNCQILNAIQNWEISCIQPSPVNQCFLIQLPICAQWESSEKCCATWATMSLKGWQDQAIFQVWQSASYFSPLDLCLFLKFKIRRGEVRICRKQYPCCAPGKSPCLQTEL